jgi:hypothetical protein
MSSTPRLVAGPVSTGITTEPTWTDADTQALLDGFLSVDPADHCVAATGAAGAGTGCRIHPDGAHRCHRAPLHVRADGHAAYGGRHPLDHICDCGAVFAFVNGGTDAIEHARSSASSRGAALALVRVLAELRGAGMEGWPVLTSIVQDVAREMKIELDL